ncbi:MAG: hypothetical protein H6726_25895 [Sandaracinaceae bacterium]|nr:hypothetical protein [Myxococcales bacterium]MCB9661107.1 hypothetical protein [Sandaracinaceae bacterium]
MARTLMLVLAALVGLPSAPVRAATPEIYDVNAVVDPATGWVRGAFRVVVDVSPEEIELRLWVLGAKLAYVPSAMDEQSARWVYPRRPDLGEATVEDLHLDGVPVEATLLPHLVDTGRDPDAAGIDLRVPIPPGSLRVILTGHFAVRIPERFGRLGRVGGRFSMLAPWYPLVVSGEGGERWQHEAEHRVRLTSTRPREWLVGGQPLGSQPIVVRGPYAPVFGARRLYAQPVVHRGARVTLYATRPWYVTPPDGAQGLDALRDLARPDRLGPLRRAVVDALDTLALSGTRGVRPPRAALLVPSRSELAGNAPSMLLVSDRAFEVLPVRAVLEYQERAVKRAFLRESVSARARRLDGPRDAGWAADLRAVWLTDLDARRREVALSTPQELLSFAAFNPAIDQLLYAPQVTFVDVYFGRVAEPDLFRDDPVQARWVHARGRLVLEYVRDALGEGERLATLARALLHEPRAARFVLASVGFDDAAVEQLLANPRLPVNYALGEITSVRRETGYVHRVEVIRQGAERPESVPVRVRDREGNVVTVSWDGGDARGTVEVETPAPLRTVWIDPLGRRPESAAVAGGHPARDNTNRLPLRPPILQRFEPTYAGGLGLAVSFGVFRKYDLENSAVVDLNLYPRSYGGSLRYVRSFGRTRDLNHRVASGSAGLAVERVLSLRRDGEDGTRYSVFGGVAYNDRRYYLDPRHGQSFSAGLRFAWVEGDAGRAGAAVSFSLHGNVTRSPSWRHAFIFVVDAAGVLGTTLEGQLQGIGGPSLLRAYEYTELLGKGRALAVAEYRLTALADLHINVFHAFYLREVQLAIFTGLGVVAQSDDGRALAPAAEVGAGVRLHFEYGGVQPSLLSLDVGVPLIEAPQFGRIVPITTVLSFEQYF